MTATPEEPTIKVTVERERVTLGAYAAHVELTPEGWRVDSPAVALVSQVYSWMGLEAQGLPDPSTFRYARVEDARAAAVTVLTAVLGTAPRG